MLELTDESAPDIALNEDLNQWRKRRACGTRNVGGLLASNEKIFLGAP